MREFLREILHALEAGRPVELVSVVRASGSTPRGAGAMMAVFPDGRAVGTVGGGSAEFESQKHAAALLEAGGEDLCRFRFIQGEAASLGMVCGGDVEVQFQYLSPADEAVLTVLREMKEACAHSADLWLVRRIEDGRVTAMGTAGRDAVRHLEAPPENLPDLLGPRAVYDGQWFAVPVVKAGRTYIFGGGHVSQALVPVLAGLDFRPVVYDDRPEFADPALFPGAEQTLCGSFLELSRHVTVTPDDCAVIMTRGHQADYEVLTQVLRSGARYIGCIGSRKKLALCRDKLLAAGFTEAEYACVHAPIGLAIGAETPAEIAISVAAEMIAVRAGVKP